MRGVRIGVWGNSHDPIIRTSDEKEGTMLCIPENKKHPCERGKAQAAPEQRIIMSNLLLLYTLSLP